MSSSYSYAELEARRKEKLRKELEETIQKVKEQLLLQNNNIAEVTQGEETKISVFLKDDAVTGFEEEFTCSGEMLHIPSKEHSTDREVIDFSELLLLSEKQPTKLEKELSSWIKKADERQILTENDVADKKRLDAELIKVIRDSSKDIEYKVDYVKMRVSSYLSSATILTESEKEMITSKYYEYCALCKIFKTNPVEKVPYKVEKEVKRLTTILEKRKQDEYVAEVVEEIMKDLGCHVMEDAVLDNTEGQIYSVGEHPSCDLFIGKDGSGILFEPVGVSKSNSLEKQRQMVESANNICSMYEIIEKKAAAKGVILKRVYSERATEEMFIRSDLSSLNKTERKKKARTQKERALNMEI